MQDKLLAPISPSLARPPAPPAVGKLSDTAPAVHTAADPSAATSTAVAPPSGPAVPSGNEGVAGHQIVPAYADGGLKSRNWSSDKPPHFSLLSNPGGIVFVVIIVGQPVGLVHDVDFFLHLIQYQTELWFAVCDTFGEAFGTYKMHYNRRNVRITPLLTTPLLSIPRRAKIAKDVVNWSSEAVPHFNALVDPGYGTAFFGTILVGQPVGVVHDLDHFLDLLRRQSEFWFVVNKTFTEAYGTYKTAFHLNNVRITPLLTMDLPSFIYRATPVPIKTPVRTKVLPRHRYLIPHTVVGPGEKVPATQDDNATIDPTLTAPRTPSNITERSRAESPIEVPSDDSDVDSLSDGEKLSIGPLTVVDGEDDARLAHLPRYPRAFSAPPRTLGGPLTLPASIHPDFTPFHDAGSTLSGASVNSRKRPEPPSAAELVMTPLTVDANTAAAAKKRRHDNIQTAFENRNKASSGPDSAHLSATPTASSSRNAPPPPVVTESDLEEFVELRTPTPPPAKKPRKNRKNVGRV